MQAIIRQKIEAQLRVISSFFVISITLALFILRAPWLGKWAPNPSLNSTSHNTESKI